MSELELNVDVEYVEMEPFGKRHQRTEECDDDCFGCRAASISFSAEATPGRRVETIRSKQLEKDYVKNSPAYKRLRAAGMQPKSVMMSDQLEKHANSKFEVESGHRLSSAKVGAKYDEVQAHLQNGGLLPIKKLSE